MGARVRRRKNVETFTAQAAYAAAKRLNERMGNKPTASKEIRKLADLVESVVEELESDGWIVLRSLATTNGGSDS